MDPETISLLASTTVAFLSPYLARVGEAAAKRIGEDLYQVVKARFSKEPTAKAALEDLAGTPDDEDIQAQLRVQLKKLMKEDRKFAAQVEQMTQEANQTEAGATIIKQVAGDNAIQFAQNFGTVEIGKN